MTETTEPKPRKGGPRDIPTTVGVKVPGDHADDAQQAVAAPTEKRDAPPEVVRIFIKNIAIKPGRRALNPSFVEQLAKSMAVVGLRTPITYRYFSHEELGGGQNDRCELVTGYHRVAAAQRLGWDYINAFEIEGPDVRDEDVELWEIDENLIRAELDAAEHALLTKRRAEIIEARAKAEEAISSQVGTKSKREKTTKNPKGAGRRKSAGSIADQAEKTGESKSKVARSRKRAEKLGVDTLQKVVGTSLGSGVELDALAKLPKEEREAKVAAAVAEAAKPEGERKKVSAKQEERALGKLSEQVVTPTYGSRKRNAPTSEFAGSGEEELLVKLWAGRPDGRMRLHQLHLWGVPCSRVALRPSRERSSRARPVLPAMRNHPSARLQVARSRSLAMTSRSLARV